MDALRHRYAQVFASLGRAELQRGADALDDLNLTNLFDEGSPLWLGFYTHNGLMLALEKYGFIDDVRRLGYERLRLELRVDDPEEHMLRLYSDRPHAEQPLVELVARRASLTLSGEVSARLGVEALGVLSIEWLQLQHPLLQFHDERPPLPGQQLPGLGLGRKVFELLRNMCLRLGLAGLVTVPSYFHNAVFYSDGFSFVDPRYQGSFRALRRALLADQDEDPERLCLATWGMRWGQVRDHDEAMAWFHEPMLAPVSAASARYLESRWYRDEVRRARHAHDITLDEQALRAQLGARGVLPFDEATSASWLRDDGL